MGVSQFAVRRCHTGLSRKRLNRLSALRKSRVNTIRRYLRRRFSVSSLDHTLHRRGTGGVIHIV